MFFETPAELLREVYVTDRFLEAERGRLEDLVAAADGVAVYRVSDQVMKAMAATDTPQGVLGVVAMPHYELPDIIKGQPLILVLDNIQDPGNLGTMIRTAEGAGASGILMSRDTVDIFNPKVVRATMGSLYRMPFVISEDLKADIELLKGQGVIFYAAHLAGQKAYDREDYRSACGILIGNEGNGLKEEIADLADIRIRIPMAGQLESLNAAMAAGILMYEAARQRR